jgi:hypothetical protein
MVFRPETIVLRPLSVHPLRAKEVAMTLEYEVQVADHTHTIRIEVPSWCEPKHLNSVREFAMSTALLEHLGYLPKGVTHAVA